MYFKLKNISISDFHNLCEIENYLIIRNGGSNMLLWFEHEKIKL